MPHRRDASAMTIEFIVPPTRRPDEYQRWQLPLFRQILIRLESSDEPFTRFISCNAE